LDEIAAGEREWVPVLDAFYRALMERLGVAEREMRDVKREVQETDLVCAECGQPLVIRWGRRGEFLAWTGYPECKNTMDFTRTPDGEIVPAKPPEIEATCEKCGSPMVVKKGRYGEFLACSNYPQCKNTRNLIRNEQGELIPEPIVVSGEVCDECGRPMVVKRSRYGLFLACTGYPECKATKPLPGEQGRRGKRRRGDGGPSTNEDTNKRMGEQGDTAAGERGSKGTRGQGEQGTRSKQKRERPPLTEAGRAAAASGETCDKCGRPMVVKRSRYGEFLACSGYPECKNTRSLGRQGTKGKRKRAGKKRKG
jgi:DNA topoisomerase-1